MMQSVAQGEDWIQNHLQSHQFFKALNTVKNKNLYPFWWVAFERFIYIFFIRAIIGLLTVIGFSHVLFTMLAVRAGS